MMVCLYFPRGAGDVYSVGEVLKILLVQIWVEGDPSEKLEIFLVTYWKVWSISESFYGIYTVR